MAFWFGIFHSVSAFTNSSFDLIHGFETANGQPGEPFLLLAVSLLIVSGGISYTVIADGWRRRRFRRLALDTKLVRGTTALLQAAFFAVVPCRPTPPTRMRWPN